MFSTQTFRQIQLGIGIALLLFTGGLVIANNQIEHPSLGTPGIIEFSPEPTCTAHAKRRGNTVIMTRACNDGFTLTKTVRPDNELVFWVDETAILGYRLQEDNGKITVTAL